MIELTQVEYGGWPTNHKLSNGHMELIITGDVGPRIIHMALPGGENLFYNDPEALGRTGDDTWQMYGGHRFWHAPESFSRTYQPDNAPVDITRDGDTIHVTQPVEPATGMQKSLEITMSADAPHVRVTHRMTNTGLWAVEVAPWALSVMAAGTVGIVPLPPRGSHDTQLLPNTSLTLWAYTNMADPRWTFAERHIILRQNSDTPGPQKIGVDVQDGWIAGVQSNTLFVKCFTHTANAPYPDIGSTAEMFTNHFMLELETLGPLQSLQPGASVDHTEDWFLFADVTAPASDTDIDQHVLPRIQEAKNHL
ncbi:MAG: hypothetical protein AAFV33_04950 [Chloroflexota bacterium]